MLVFSHFCLLVIRSINGDIRVPARSPKPKRSRIQIANRSAIMEAALAVFSTDGYRGATIDRIAKQAGMSKPNLLYYFPTKEDVYRAVLEGTVEAWLDPLAKLDPDGNALAELKRYILFKMKMSEENPLASRFFANEIGRGAPLLKPYLEHRLKDLVDEKAGVLVAWMKAGKIREVDPYHLIFSIWAITQHYADFEVQIAAIMGDRAKYPEFFGNASDTILTILFEGVSTETKT